jgi:hypothetical protein
MIDVLKTGLLAAAFASISQTALALSCAPPDLRETFNRWADSPDIYYIGVGTLTPTAPLPKVKHYNNSAQPTAAPYRFVGEALWIDRTFPLDRPVTVTARCVGPWCSGFPTAEQPKLMALKVAEDGSLSIDVGPCDAPFFEASKAEMIQGCLKDGRCAGRN